MTKEAIYANACKLKKMAKVALRIIELQAAEAKKFSMTRDELLDFCIAIVTADPTELVEIHRVSCPACYRKDRRAEPNPHCYECFGEGEPRVVIADTTKLTGAAKYLLERVRITKDGGIEIILRGQLAALETVLKYLMAANEATEKLPKDTEIKKMTTDPIEAAKIYEQFIAGN